MLKPSDGQLVAKAAAGDDSAFDELVSRYRTRVYHLALSKVRGRDNALDLAQEAFVQAYLSLGTLREPDKFGSWLSGITANLCKMYLRRGSDVLLPPEMIDELRTPADTDPNAAAAREALDQLPNGTRSAAILYFIEEMKQTEIAEFLGISLSAVKSRIRDARASLQKEMIHMVKQSAKKDEPGDDFSKSLKHRLELARWYREFGEMVRAGTTLVSALAQLEAQDFSSPVKMATAKLNSAIQAGATLSDALKDCPALQTPEAFGLIRVGEMDGALEVTLDTLADCIEARRVIRDVELSYWCRVLGAMLASGVGILSALNSAAEVAVNEELKVATREIIDIINARGSMRPVLERHPDLFSPLALAAIIGGEYSGTLDYTLQWLAGELASEACTRLSPLREQRDRREEIGSALADPLIRFLADESAPMRSGAVALLRSFGVKESASHIAPLLEDADPGVRGAALVALVGFGFTGAHDATLKMLSDPEQLVRRAAVRAVVCLGPTDAGASIAAIIPDQDQRVTRAAIAVLESIGEIDVLTNRAIELLGSDESRERNCGAGILMSHPTPQAADALIERLEHSEDDWMLRSKVVMALARIGRREAVPELIALIDGPALGWWLWTLAESAALLGDVSVAPHIREAITAGRLSAHYAYLADQLEDR